MLMRLPIWNHSALRSWRTRVSRWLMSFCQIRFCMEVIWRMRIQILRWNRNWIWFWRQMMRLRWQMQFGMKAPKFWRWLETGSSTTCKSNLMRSKAASFSSSEPQTTPKRSPSQAWLSMTTSAICSDRSNRRIWGQSKDPMIKFNHIWMIRCLKG